ncbi:MAG TPA: 2-amino-4-hydroxy-6-hydroxymethyldihydropteridine diphosphokinase [Flavobacteriales bacterium]|nr:2-amino-4-hydroxy-6-hydroxymethyldihydropteridine diphosphokinase [Flavobacteriales bacterium]
MEQNRTSNSIYLGIGGNKSGTADAIRRCIDSLNPEFQVELVSKWYSSKAWGNTDQNDFINLVVKGSSELSPIDLMAHLLNMESHLGRDRLKSEKWGPRLIDLDILFWEGLRSTQTEIRLPHPHLLERSFALIPLLEVGPHLLQDEYFSSLTSQKLSTLRIELNEITL